MEVVLVSFRQPALLLLLSAIGYLAASGIGIVFLSFRAPKGSRVSALGSMLSLGAPFAILGVVVGYVTGMSRDPAVAAVVPGILTLVGGAVLILTSEGGVKAATSSAMVVYLSIGLVAGIDYGARKRYEFEQIKNSFDVQIDQVNREANIRAYRRGLGLPEVPGASD